MKVVLENISKAFGAKLLFEHINAELDTGRCLVVTGNNGSGKSTLLKIVAGLMKPSSGSIRFYSGNQVNQQVLQGTVGMVSPEMAMYPALTGLENVLFWTKLRGLAITEAKASELCCYVGLSGNERCRVEHYSTGMKQRLKLAVLLALNPPVWLLDEPSANLDEHGKELIARLIDRALTAQAAVLLATNEAREVGYGSARIAL